MEALVVREGGLTADQATIVVGLAKTSNLLFGGTADYQVALEFGDAGELRREDGARTLSFLRWPRAIARSRWPRRAEIHRILNQLRILPGDLTKLRVEHGQYLPGRSSEVLM